MTSHFAEYIKERQGKEIIEDEKGFATYFVTGKYMYIEDIYVKKEFRKDGVASAYADKIAIEAKERGIDFLLGSVDTTAFGATESMKVLLAYGFRVLECQGQGIYFEKKIGDIHG